MTSYPATHLATFAPADASRLGADPVRARVNVKLQLTNDQILQADAATHPAADALHLPPDTRGGPRGPHPGDVLYWVACVGGACLLLMAATN